MAKKRTGTFLRVPYDWRRPTWSRVRRAWWDPRSRHLLVPRAFGWGYDVNLAELTRRLRLRR